MSSNIIDRFDRYMDKMRITLLPYQKELAHMLLQLPYSAKITQCRQSGKSFILGFIIYFLAYIKHWDIVITAPKLEQTWAIMRHVHKAQARIGSKTVYNNRYGISLRGRGSIQCLSGSETASVEGASAHLVVIDEHQGIDATHCAEIFLPMLSWTDGLYWSSGIGGPPSSVAERKDIDLVWVKPYQEVIDVKPNYQRLVDIARREMLPEQFKAHYECLSLDISSHLLIPEITPYTVDIPTTGTTRVGVDWGKRRDQSVATVIHESGKNIYITDWLVPTGNYDTQMDQLTDWLKNHVAYDTIISENVGVGDSATDFLVKAMKDPQGFDSGVYSHGVSAKWKSKQSVTLNKMAGNGTLLYNSNHPLSEVFRKDITQVGYKMLDSNLCKPDHSDFLSSLMLAIQEPSVAYM